MANKNETLPDNLKGLISQLSTHQAMPLGSMSGYPFLAVRIPADQEQLITDGEITCEMKPSVFNIDFDETTIALCFVQIRLNKRNDLIYTAYYNLADERQYNDCHELLNMRNYGICVASENIHDFLSFDAAFEADFDPRNIIAGAKANATEYSPDLTRQIAQIFFTQAATSAELWEQFNTMAPFEKKWYARMRMESK